MTWLSQLFGFLKVFQIWIVVAPWESGLRVRFGKSAKTLTPGPHWRIPFLDRIFVQSVRLRTISDSGQTMTTKDGRTLSIAVALTYQIVDIKKLYMTVSNPEMTLLLNVQGYIAQVVANSESNALTPDMIQKEAGAQIPSVEWGLGSMSLVVTSFAFAKTFRLLNYEYRSLSSANELEAKP